MTEFINTERKTSQYNGPVNSSDFNLKIEHYENGGEHRIKATKKYDADGYCKEINTIFEFQGCYYHGCKKCFNEKLFL